MVSHRAEGIGGMQMVKAGLGSRRHAVRPTTFVVSMLVVLGLALAGCEEDSASAPQDAASDVLSSDTTAPQCKSDAECPVSTTACQIAACSVTGTCGLVDAPDGKACDDGDACTVDTSCAAGVCVGTSSCECTVDADCTPLEDGDACNGTLYCDLSGAKPACKVNPSTVVSCDDSADTACTSNVCQKATGSCAMTAKADGTACDDGNDCTGPDACASGACGGAPTCACQVDDDCKASDDGNPCNGTLYCDTSGAKPACKVNPATIVACTSAEDTACFASQCQPKDGSCKMGPMPDTTTCDLDGSVCSLDHCAGGACVPGPLDAPCNCKVDADCVPFDDGNFCNGVLFCNIASGFCELNPATKVACPTASDTTCLRNECAPKTGLCKMTPQPEGMACDDGWDCTKAEVCTAGVCKAATDSCVCQSTADCAQYEAANGCAKLYCNKPAGVCKANPATITFCQQTGDPACSVTACNKTTGACEVVAKNEGGPCEADGSWCTSLDTCVGGACKAASSKCPCKADKDCAAFDDNNPCNGTLFCDLPTGSCLVNPATKVSCDGEGEGQCKPLQCDPKDGACKALPLPDGATCDTDSFVCTTEACSAGACKLVDESCLCWDDSDCAPFDDGNACNGTLYCNKNGGPPFCEVNPATIPSCPAPLPGACTVSVCDPSAGGCVAKPGNEGGTCQDGDICTKDDACAGGTCAGLPVDVATLCDDNNPCTDEACLKGKGCVHTGNSAACDDGDACTTGDACSASTCVTTPIDCDDNNPCTTDSCDAKTGCVHTPATGTPCDDGDVCTAGDVCASDAGCKPNGPTSCDDNNVCTTDSCVAGQGCQNQNNLKPCDDGDACTDGDICAKGKCSPGSPKTCNDSDPCTDDACDPSKGCTITPNKAPCTDGSACTTGDACDAGSCKPGTPVVCDDGNLCTKDLCEAASGCVNAPSSGSCDDGDACTKGDACDAGSCKAGSKVTCDDGEPCTQDLCDAKAGCITIDAADGSPCRDADACNNARTCSSGKCGSTPPTGFGNVVFASSPALRIVDAVPLGGSSVAGIALGSAGSYLYETSAAGLQGVSGKLPLPVNVTAGSYTHLVRLGAELWLAGVGESGGKTVNFFTQSSGGALVKPFVVAASNDDKIVEAGPVTGDEIAWVSSTTFHKVRTVDGAALAQLPLTLPSTSVFQGSGMTRLSDEDWLVFGVAKLSTLPIGVAVARVRAPRFKAPRYLWRTSNVTTPATVASVDSAALTADGTVVVAARLSSGPVLYRFDGTTGAATGTVSMPKWTTGAYSRLVVDGNGALALFGDIGASGSEQPQLAVFDQNLAVADVRSLALPLGGSVLAATSRDVGGWVVAGAAKVAAPGTTVPFIVTLNDALDTTCNADAPCDGKTSQTCTDNNPCTLDVCNPASGCVHVTMPANYGCDDGDKCTVGDGCVGGVCKGGSVAPCDDGNLCTNASCDSKIGCTYVNLSGTPCVGGNCDGAGKCTVRADAPTHGTAASYGAFINSKPPYPRVEVFGPNIGTIFEVTASGAASPEVVADSADARVVAVGKSLTCMIDRLGVLSCGGYAGNKKVSFASAVDLGAPAAWVAGRSDTFCALTTKNEVWCWTGALVPVKELGPPTSGSWAGVTVGGQHKCAWQYDGKAVCWGAGAYGQLGAGSQPSTPVDGASAADVIVASNSAPLSKVTAVCAGDLFSCARTSDSKVHCWGHNLYGQLGNGGGSIANKATPVSSTGGGASLFGELGAQTIQCGADFACTTAKNPTFNNPQVFVEKSACWGRGDRGQLGNGSGKDAKVWTPLSMASGGVVPPSGRMMGPADVAMCLRKDDDALCWGSNESGLLGLFGNGGVADPYVPDTPLVADTGKPLANITSLRGFGGLYCTLDSASNDLCWGRNDGSGIAAGDTAGSFDLATGAQSTVPPTSIARSPNIGCQITAAAIECWGDNRFGYALGFLVGGSGSYIKTPTALPGSGNAKSIVTGIGHSCATVGTYPANTLYCWGRNQDGELGRGSSGGALGFGKVTHVGGASFDGVKDFAVGSGRTCAIDANDNAWCWGRNQYGEAGKAPGAAVLAPNKVSTKVFSTIVVGHSQTCAIDQAPAKAVWCWGYNGGTSGNYLGAKDAASSRATAVQVAWAEGFAGLAISDSQWTSVPYVSTTCGVTLSGKVVCWGAAYNGALGNGSTSTPQSSLPLETPNIGNAATIVAGDRSFCALKTDKTVACWGQRAYAQTGRGASIAYYAFNPFP